MTLLDYYAVLGVSPDAEDIVIAAAYRALAQRYHPDKSRGSESSHAKMAALNEAYAVLSDQARRVEYDRSYRQFSEQRFDTQDDDEKSHAFSDALNELDDRWKVATSVYPDIELVRKRLTRFSTQLAFAYVTTLLERKDFARRREIGEQLEEKFLSKYFGSNELVVEYAREVILSGRRDAAKALNRLVEVLGSPVNAQPYVEKIEADFNVRASREAHANKDAVSRRLQHLRRVVRAFGHYDEAKEIAKIMGFDIEEFGGGLFTSTKIRVKHFSSSDKTFDNVPQFVDWVKLELCADY